MSELTRDDVREIVKKETSHLATKEQVDEVLKKVDGFLKGIETEEQERVVGDAQLERRVETLEQKTGVR